LNSKRVSIISELRYAVIAWGIKWWIYRSLRGLSVETDNILVKYYGNEAEKSKKGMKRTVRKRNNIVFPPFFDY